MYPSSVWKGQILTRTERAEALANDQVEEGGDKIFSEAVAKDEPLESADSLPSIVDCRSTKDCADGWACVDGTCINTEGSNLLETPGDCDLEDEEENPCGEEGGCDKSTCGEDLDDGDLDCCGETIYRGMVVEEETSTSGEKRYVSVWKEQWRTV